MARPVQGWGVPSRPTGSHALTGGMLIQGVNVERNPYGAHIGAYLLTMCGDTHARREREAHVMARDRIYTRMSAARGAGAGDGSDDRLGDSHCHAGALLRDLGVPLGLAGLLGGVRRCRGR